MNRILYLSSVPPFSPFTGHTYRTVGVLRWLVDRARVDVVFRGTEEDLQNSFIPRARFGRLVAVPPANTIADWIRAAAGRLPYHHAICSSAPMKEAVHRCLASEHYDLIWMNQTVHYPVLEGEPDLPPVVADQHAAERMAWDSMIRADPRWYVRLFVRWNKWRDMRYERSVYPRLAGVVAISQPDLEATQRDFMARDVICVPQGVDTTYYKSGIDGIGPLDTLLFSGTGVTRNVAAMKRLVKRIMPLVHQRVPAMRLLWIGNVDRSRHAFLRQSWIRTSGFVPHSPPLFDEGAIYLAPFDMGEGMKTKIVEAMAMGKVIVATPVGVTGVETAGLPFIAVCQTDQQFADAILEFRQRKDLAALGQMAREHACSRYAWNSVLAPLEPFLERCAGHEQREVSQC